LVLAGDAAEAVVSADVERDEPVGFERFREQGCGASAAQAPAGRESSRAGMSWAVASQPIWAASAWRAGTPTSERPIWDIWSPAREMLWPVQ
jgi:hypothetical protein